MVVPVGEQKSADLVGGACLTTGKGGVVDKFQTIASLWSGHSA